MNKVQSVSLPRTGHHLLVNCLKNYFEEFKYCSFYNCCYKLECPLSPVFQKNHDVSYHEIFKNGRPETVILPYLSPDLDKPYIIQYRKDAQSTLNAMYRNLRMKGIFGKNVRVSEEELKPYLEKERKDFLKFCFEKREYYHSFIQKWIIYNKNPKAYFLS